MALSYTFLALISRISQPSLALYCAPQCSIAFRCSQRGFKKAFQKHFTMSVEHFAIASVGFFVLLASFAVQRKE